MRAALSSVKSRIKKGLNITRVRYANNAEQLVRIIGINYWYIYKRYKLKFRGVRTLARADGSSKFQRFLRSCTVS